jgi:hypothetical protein
MFTPPPDGRQHAPVTEPTAQSILVSYLLMAAIPLTLWVVSHPLVGVAGLVTALGVGLTARRAASLVRCISECGGFAVDLGERVRITVSQTRTDDVC